MDRAVDTTAHGAVDTTADEIVDTIADEASDRTADEAVDTTAYGTVDTTADEASDRTADEAVDITVDESVDTTADEADDTTADEHLSGAPHRGGCTPTPDGVGPNRPHLSFCSEPFGLEQRTLGIASVPQGTKEFVILNGEWACSARQAETNQQQQQQQLIKQLKKSPCSTNGN